MNRLLIVILAFLSSTAVTEETFRLTVEDSFKISGRGTVVIGTLEQGTLRVGDRVRVVGDGRDFQARVDGLEVSKKAVSEVRAGEPVTVFLGGLGQNEVRRRQVLEPAGGDAPSPSP